MRWVQANVVPRKVRALSFFYLLTPWVKYSNLLMRESLFQVQCDTAQTYSRCWGDFSQFSVTYYVIFYSLANFFIPLLIRIHSYSNICSTLWR